MILKLKYIYLIFYFQIIVSFKQSNKNCEFRLYSRRNKDLYFDVTEDNLKTSFFSRGRNKTYFIVHGYHSKGSATWAIDIKNGLLEIEDANVFIVDWSLLSSKFDYVKVAHSINIIGMEIAGFVSSLDVTFEKIHCIGHSLGAHACGFCGKSLKIGRISGLDPAGPEFRDVPETDRLDKNDAVFVDIIHTDQELGLEKAIGNVDFYPNNGRDQPNCLLIDEESFDNMISCSHTRAAFYFAESITSNCKFTAETCGYYSLFISSQITQSCNCCGYMGFDALKSNYSGSFYLKTNGIPPFCIN